MSKTTDYLTFMVDVTPYNHEGNSYDALNIIVSYRKAQGFCVSYQPVKRQPMGYMTGPMCSTDPLVKSTTLQVKAAPRNNVATLTAMSAALQMAKEGIKFYFDQRNYEGLKAFMVDVSSYGYTPDVQKHLQETISSYNAMSKSHEISAAEQEQLPIMRQYHELKSKHPDAVLLFRCGDFYETYNDDAKVCADILGITLTKSTKTGVNMAGFPYHALDTYLPKLIRAGQRVAICDQLEDPKTTQTNNNIKKTMATKTMATTATTKNETINVADAQVNNAIDENTVEEVTDVVVAKPSDKPQKPQVTLKRKQQPKAEEPEVVSVGSDLPEVTFSTYKTKKGNTAPQIIGFSGEDDPRWKTHKDSGDKWVSCSWRKDLAGEKVYCLVFGTKYMEVAKALADAYNTSDRDAWERAEQACQAVYEQSCAAGKAAWEAKKAEWAEKKAARESKKSAATPAATQGYSAQDVADMLQKVLDGGELPAEIEALMNKAA